MFYIINIMINFPKKKGRKSKKELEQIALQKRTRNERKYNRRTKDTKKSAVEKPKGGKISIKNYIR